MESGQFYLFRDKRFLPLFIVQFLGCLNDNILKSALIILITFKLTEDSLPFPSYVMLMMANAALILPFVVFASLAGQITDKYERAFLVKLIKISEIIIICFASIGFIQTNLLFLYSSIFFMGIHSTFFGPIKYSLLPDILRKEELLGANGLVEAGTFLSILIGTMIGGCYNLSQIFVISSLVISSLLGLFFSFYIPKARIPNQDLTINLNLFQETISMIRYSSSKQIVHLCILGISWFWFISAAIMSQIPALTHDILGADENVVNLFLATFSIGVGVGSFLCSKICQNEITTKYIFIAALGISIFGIDLYFASKIAAVNYHPEHLKSIFDFLSKKHYWRILFDLFCLAAVGGLYVVPLFALMQYHASAAYRSRVIASNNLVNSLFMVASTGILLLLFHMGFSIPAIILLVSIMNVVVAIHIYTLIPSTKIVPFKLWTGIFKFFFDKIYDIEVRGLKNYYKSGNRTVIIANHLSYIDPALIAIYLPQSVTFAINSRVAEELWIRPFLKIVKTFPIEQNSPMAIKALIAEVKKNKKIAIFPEGRISTTGSLMKIYEGPGMIADKANASILPIRVEGTEFTRFSKVKNVPKHGFFAWKRRKIIISILPSVKVELPDSLSNRDRRKYIGQALYDIMSGMMFKSSDYKSTLFSKLINASNIYGKNRVIMQDVQGNDFSYKKLISGIFTFANLFLDTYKKHNKNIGVMMPNTVGTCVVFLGLQVAGFVPAMINFTVGAKHILEVCDTALLKTVITTKIFAEQDVAYDVIDALTKHGIEIIFIEDLKSTITTWIKIKSFLGRIFASHYYAYLNPEASPEDVAVILFKSGALEPTKAVALSHENINANICQFISKIDFNPHDIAFNTLPLFHSVGLTGAMLMLTTGVRTFYYQSALHYKIIPDLIYDINATILIATDSFLNGYAKYAHPYDFYSVRYVFSGVERLKDNTRQTWLDKFGIRILEFYGSTETSTIISVNTPMHYKINSVGRLMPGIEYFIKPIKSMPECGILCIKGPNIMLGYISNLNPGIIEPTYTQELGPGWHETGDVVKIDNEGYITIIDRYTRLAEIGDIMVSLDAVENLCRLCNPAYANIAIFMTNPSDVSQEKQIILFTDNPNLQIESIEIKALEQKISELHIPRMIQYIKTIPLFVTGKVNYVLLKAMLTQDV